MSTRIDTQMEKWKLQTPTYLRTDFTCTKLFKTVQQPVYAPSRRSTHKPYLTQCPLNIRCICCNVLLDIPRTPGEKQVALVGSRSLDRFGRCVTHVFHCYSYSLDDTCYCITLHASLLFLLTQHSWLPTMTVYVFSSSPRKSQANSPLRLSITLPITWSSLPIHWLDGWKEILGSTPDGEVQQVELTWRRTIDWISFWASVCCI
jgi:hypothetical protein